MNLKKLSAVGMVACSLTMGTAGLVASSVPALAAPAVVNPSNIDTSATYNLNITKYLGVSTGGTNDGTQQAVTGHDLLQGVPFDVYKVGGVDLTTNDGWAAATALQNYTITATDIKNGYITVGTTQYPLTKVTTAVTDASGQATYGTAGDAGLYLVNENLAGATVTDVTTGKTVATSSITPSAPFLVTLPMTDPTNLNNWMSTVYVYPKNVTDSLTKTVTDLTTAAGTGTTSTDSAANGAHEIDYGLNGTITPGLTGSQMGMYVLADQLDPRLTFSSVKSVTLSTGTALTAGTDYQVYVNGTLNGAGTGGDQVQIVMTSAGLDKLAAAESNTPGATVDAVIATDLGSEAASGLTAGEIPNTAAMIPNESWWNSQSGVTPVSPTNPYNPGTTSPTNTGTPGVPSNTVDSKYGDLSLTKVDGANTSKTLAGAQFSLFQTMGSSMTPTAGDCSTVTTSGTPIETGITTGSNGAVTVKGLQESDFYNNVQQPATGGSYIVYCLVETTAPSGYNLLAQPVAFTINQDSAAGAVALTVKDEAHNLSNSLPLTGGKGAATLGLGGLALLGGGAAVMVLRRRRNDEDLEGAADDLA